MTDTISTAQPQPDRFGLNMGIASSKRREAIATAQRDGEPFDGLTDRDIALMVERGVQAIMAAQTVRGRFLGQVDQLFVLALYIAGTAASEDVVRLFDAIAEGKSNLKDLLDKIREHLENVETERKKDEAERRDADAASNAKMLEELGKGETADPEDRADHASASPARRAIQQNGPARPAGGLR